MILRGSASIYIDPKMTGEGLAVSEGTLSRKSDRKKVAKKPPKAPESEVSILSGMEVQVPSEDADEKPEAGNETETEKEEQPEEDENETQMVKKPTKPLAPVDRNKFGKFIANYGEKYNFKATFDGSKLACLVCADITKS